MDLHKYGKFILGAFLLYSGVVVLFTQKQEIINTWTEYSVSTSQASLDLKKTTTVEEMTKIEQEIAKSKGILNETPVVESEDETSNSNNLSSVLQNEVFKNAITLALALFAFIKWIDFFAAFKPENAMSSLIVPGLATFLSFKWQALLAWFQLV